MECWGEEVQVGPEDLRTTRVVEFSHLQQSDIRYFHCKNGIPAFLRNHIHKYTAQQG